MSSEVNYIVLVGLVAKSAVQFLTRRGVLNAKKIITVARHMNGCDIWADFQHLTWISKNKTNQNTMCGRSDCDCRIGGVSFAAFCAWIS